MGVFGGTFDPIHYGHLRTAFELRNKLDFSEVRFMPCGTPPHRNMPQADAATRLKMVQAATADQAGFVVDDREMRRDGPSYSVDTLDSLRDQFPRRPLCLVVGMDAFLSLPTWQDWRTLLQLGHLIVAHRPGWSTPDMGVLGELLKARGTGTMNALHENPAGKIYIHAVTQLEISSTAIRDLINRGGDPRFLIPDKVRDIIQLTGCYQSSNKETEFAKN